MPSNAEIHYLSAREQGELIRTRQLSPVELVRSALDRIERYDPVLRAFITVCGERALDDAPEGWPDCSRFHRRTRLLMAW